MKTENTKQETPEDIEKVLKAAWALALALNRTIDKALPIRLANIVKLHSLASAIIAALIAWVPAFGPITASLLSVICIWSMYFRINKSIDISQIKNLFRTLISGAASNLAAYIIAILVATALSFTFIINDIIMIFVTYYLTLACGILYLKLLTKVFKAGQDPVLLSMDHINQLVNEVKNHDDIKPCIDDANVFIKEKTAQAKSVMESKITEIACGKHADNQKQLKND